MMMTINVNNHINVRNNSYLLYLSFVLDFRKRTLHCTGNDDVRKCSPTTAGSWQGEKPVVNMTIKEFKVILIYAE